MTDPMPRKDVELPPRMPEAATIAELQRALLDARADTDAAVALAYETAAKMIEGTAYTSNGDKRSLEPVGPGLAGMDMHHATIAAAIRALAPADGLAAVEALRKEQTSSPNPYDDCAHFDDHAVNRFAVAMKGKLAAKRLQGRGGWQEPDVANGYLSRLLREHVDKGDPVDVANLAMMIHQRGERIGPENEGATCGAIERAEAERDRLAADLAQARADAQAAVALVVERAADACVALADQVSDAALTGLPEQARLRESMEAAFTKASHIIRALAPADGLAALEALRKERDRFEAALGRACLVGGTTYLIEIRDRLAAELAAAQQREAGQAFDKADWFWRTMDPDDCGDSPEKAINRAMVGQFCVCEIASSFSGPTRYGFVAPVLDPESDDEEFVHFATQQEAIDAAKARAALSHNGRGE